MMVRWCTTKSGPQAEWNNNYWKNDQLKKQLRWRSPGQDVCFGLIKMGNAWCHIDGSIVNFYHGKKVMNITPIIISPKNLNAYFFIQIHALILPKYYSIS